MDTFNMNEFYPAPFPDDVPIVNLEKISLNKLLNGDADEAHKMFEICTTRGFFYLDMTDHPKGQKLLKDACVTCQAGKEILPNHSIEEKSTYKSRPRLGVFDMGYICKHVAEDGQPRFSESINIPVYELLAPEQTGFQLPPWLAHYEDSFKAAMKSGNVIANVILGILERELLLPPGAFTSLHRLTDPSSDFLRVLRYPGYKSGKTIDQLSFPPHKDALSLAILFTWLGGLQLPLSGTERIDVGTETEESWGFVKPIPGYAIVNLGDAMEVLTNKVLRSGLHRVVKAPGQQAPFDRYSVVVGARPNNKAIMRAFKSPMIPEDTPEQAKAEVMTSEQWGMWKMERLKAQADKIEGLGK